MRVVEVSEVQTSLSTKDVAELFREKITKSQSKGFRLIAGKFNWSFYTPQADDGPFAQFAPQTEAPSYAVAAHAVRPERGGMVRQTADAMATGNFLLEIWDRGQSREVRLTAPASTAWKSYTGNFINNLAGLDAGAKITRSEYRVPEA